MKTRATAVLGSTLLFAGALLLTSCDNTQLPPTPSVEEQDGAENQHEGPDQQDEQDEGTDRQNGQNEDQDGN
ncbi:hypothetical protein ACX80D_16205 [Arthrobacter sp. Sr24]